MYYVYDENGELMRVVKRHDELKHLLEIYHGWTFRYVRNDKKPVDLTKFKDAPF